MNQPGKDPLAKWGGLRRLSDEGELSSWIYMVERSAGDRLSSYPPLATAIAAVNAEFDAASDFPNLATLQAVVVEFQKLATEQQRELMNGWMPRLDYPPIERIAHPYCGDFVRAGLVIENGSPAGVPVAFQSFVNNHGSTADIQIEIIEGASKARVLNVLRETARLVASRWDELIGNAEKRPSPPPHTSTPGSNESERAAVTTA